MGKVSINNDTNVKIEVKSCYGLVTIYIVFRSKPGFSTVGTCESKANLVKHLDPKQTFSHKLKFF